MTPNKSPLVSIIINCYNGAKYLHEALLSVINQDFQDWELIFWDNISTDNSKEIFYSFKDSRFFYHLAQNHTSLGTARNLAVDVARGKWIAFLDCDDVWLSSKLRLQVALTESSDMNIGFVYSDIHHVIEGKSADTIMAKSFAVHKKQKKSTKLPEGDIFNQLLFQDFVPLSTSLINKSAYKITGGIDNSLKQAEDYDIFLKISKFFPVRAIQEPLVIYRIHEDNLTHSQQELNYSESIKIISKYLPNPAARSGILNHSTSLAIYFIRSGQPIRGLYEMLARGSIYLLCRKAIHRIYNLTRRRLVAIPPK